MRGRIARGDGHGRGAGARLWCGVCSAAAVPHAPAYFTPRPSLAPSVSFSRPLSLTFAPPPPVPELSPPPSPSLLLLLSPPQGTSEAAPEAVRSAVGGGCHSGWGAVTVGYECR